MLGWGSGRLFTVPRSAALSLFEYLRENWIDVVNDAILHVDLTLAAVALAVLVGMTIGLLTYRRRWLGSLATTTTAAFLTIPSIALLGILIGPFGLGQFSGQMPWLTYVTISNTHAIEPFAEFGIIMLLFSIGLELSFRRLWGMRRLVFGVGAGQLFASAVLIGVGVPGRDVDQPELRVNRRMRPQGGTALHPGIPLP